MVKIHNPLTALLCWDKLSIDRKINSSNYTIHSILLSEQQAAQTCNFGRKHQLNVRWRSTWCEFSRVYTINNVSLIMDNWWTTSLWSGSTNYA